MGSELSKLIHEKTLGNEHTRGFGFNHRGAIRCKLEEHCSDKENLTLEDFTKMLGVRESTSVKIFEAFDLDGNGIIDDFEFFCFLAHVTRNDNRLDSIFTIFDPNEEQICSFEDFKAMIEAILTISAEPPVTEENLNKKMDEILKENKISDPQFPTVEEFKDIVMSDPELIQGLINIGIFSEEELSSTKLNDLMIEESKFYKFEDEREEIQMRKKGIESMSTAEVYKGLLGLIKSSENTSNKGIDTKKIAEACPDGFEPNASLSYSPGALITLEHVFGYRGYDTRNNLFLNPDNQLLFHTAQLGIQMDLESKKQEYNVQNTDEVISMDVWQDLAATGEIAENPVLTLWNNKTMQNVAIFSGVIKKGIQLLRFSHCGEYLAACSLEEDRDIYILKVEAIKRQLEDEIVVHKVEGPLQIILDLRFTWNNKNFALSTKKHVYFTELTSQGLTLKKSTGWSKGKFKKQAVLSLGVTDQDIIGGGIQGQLLRFKGSNLFESIPAHRGAVNSILTRKKFQGIYSGGDDGLVIQWDDQMNQLKTFNLQNYNQVLVPKVRALAEHTRMSDLVIGMRSCEVVRIDLEKPQNKEIITAGHFKRELWGMTTVPNSNCVITCGDDCMVGVWDTQEKVLLRKAKVPYITKRCCVSPKEPREIFVGCKNGSVLVLDYDNLNIKSVLKSRKKEIADIKISPNGELLAVAAQDQKIIVYSNPWGSKNPRVLDGHTGPVIKLNWSEDSRYLLSNSSEIEVFYWDMKKFKLLENGYTDLRNTKWQGWQCIYGWPVQGIWPKSSDLSDINAVCKSPSGKLLATSDDYGNIKMFHYPCVKKGSNFNRVAGHTNHVSCVLFGDSDERLFSIGAHDKSLMVWNVTIATLKPKMILEALLHEDRSGAVSTHRIDQKPGLGGFGNLGGLLGKTEEPSQQNSLQGSPQKGAATFGLLGKISHGMDQLSAKVESLFTPLKNSLLNPEEKPFKKIVKKTVPDNFKEHPRAKYPPDGNLFLRHALGYRSWNCKDTCKFGRKDGVIFYAAAAVIVKHDPSSAQENQFFTEHSTDVASFDLSTDGKYGVSGSLLEDATMNSGDFYIWSTEDMKEVGRISGLHGCRVKLLAFSPDSRFVLSIGNNPTFPIAIHDWRNERLLCTSKINSPSVLGVAWKNNESFTTLGKNHIKFWSMGMNSLNLIHGDWGESPAESLVCLTFINEICFTGSTKGNIIGWEDNKKISSIKAHDESVFCIQYSVPTMTMYSGCQGGVVKAWKVSKKKGELSELQVVFDYTKVTTFSSNPSYSKQSGVRSIDINIFGKVLVGLRTSDIFILDKKDNFSPTLMFQAHSEGLISGLCVNQNSSAFVTSSSDSTIRLWDAITGKVKNIKTWRTVVTALDWSQDGSFIVGATADGDLIFFDEALELLAHQGTKFAELQNPVSEVKIWQPTNNIGHDYTGMIAVGGHGASSPIEIFTFDLSNSKVSKISLIETGMSGGIKSIDWSTDGIYIMAASTLFDMAFLNIKLSEKIKPKKAKNIDWLTWTSPYGFFVDGTYKSSSGENISAVCRSETRQVVATMDDKGRVSIFRYPSTVKKSGCKTYVAHSGVGSRIRFFMNDNCMISTGCDDRTIFVWATDFGDDGNFKSAILKGQNIDFDP